MNPYLCGFLFFSYLWGTWFRVQLYRIRRSWSGGILCTRTRRTTYCRYLGNNYPVIIGGGYKMDSATVMILEKKNDELRIKVLNVRGEVLLDITV